MQIINETFNTFDDYDKDKIVYEFEILRQNIFNSYKKGSLTDFQFDYLDRKILNYIEKISKLK